MRCGDLFRWRAGTAFAAARWCSTVTPQPTRRSHPDDRLKQGVQECGSDARMPLERRDEGQLALIVLQPICHKPDRLPATLCDEAGKREHGRGERTGANDARSDPRQYCEQQP